MIAARTTVRETKKKQSGFALAAGRQTLKFVKLVSVIGIVLVACGVTALGAIHASAIPVSSARTGVNPAAGGAMLVSGAILLFSGKNRIS